MTDTEKAAGENPESVAYSPGKGSMALIAAGSAAVIGIAAFIAWYVLTVGLSSIHPALPYALGIAVVAVVLFLFAGVAAVAASLATGKDMVSVSLFRGLLVKLFLPLMVMVGGFLKIKRISMEKAFIELNNRMVRAMVKGGRRFNPEKLLILMPHCIQDDNCAIKVTRDVKNCVNCGRCEIGGLVRLSEKYGITLFVLTGGTVARRRLQEFRPDAVVAVACERDLTSGVQDAYPLPVLAIVNKRPYGYCVQTGVAVEEIEGAVEELLGKREAMKAA